MLSALFFFVGLSTVFWFVLCQSASNYKYDIKSCASPWSNVLVRSFVRLRKSQSSSPATAHIGRPHSSWTAALGMAHNALTFSTCMGQLDLLHKYRCSKLVDSLFLGGKGIKRRGDERHHHNAGLQKSGKRKKLPLPYDLWRL